MRCFLLNEEEILTVEGPVSTARKVYQRLVIVYLFLVWLLAFVLAVIAFKWILMLVAVRLSVQEMLERQSEAQFLRFVLVYSSIAVIVIGGQVVALAWPPTLENILDFLRSWFFVVAIGVQAVIWLSPLLVCFDFWRRRNAG